MRAWRILQARTRNHFFVGPRLEGGVATLPMTHQLATASYTSSGGFPWHHFRVSVWTHSLETGAPSHDAPQMSNLISWFGDFDTAPIGRSMFYPLVRGTQTDNPHDAPARYTPPATSHDPLSLFCGSRNMLIAIPNIFVGPQFIGPQSLWILGQAHWTHKNVLSESINYWKNASYCISGPTSFCKPEDQIGHLWAASSLGAPVPKLCTQTHTMKRPLLRQTQTDTPRRASLPPSGTPPATSQDSISVWHHQQLPKTAFPHECLDTQPTH